jgi:hypothetical protein
MIVPGPALVKHLDASSSATSSNVRVPLVTVTIPPTIRWKCQPAVAPGAKVTVWTKTSLPGSMLTSTAGSSGGEEKETGSVTGALMTFAALVPDASVACEASAPRKNAKVKTHMTRM